MGLINTSKQAALKDCCRNITHCMKPINIDNLHSSYSSSRSHSPTWLWGRWGRHNSPLASFVMDLVFRRSDGSHVSVDTVHPSRSSSLSSPGWCHLQGLSSHVVLVSPNYVANHFSRAFLNLSMILLPAVSP